MGLLREIWNWAYVSHSLQQRNAARCAACSARLKAIEELLDVVTAGDERLQEEWREKSKYRCLAKVQSSERVQNLPVNPNG